MHPGRIVHANKLRTRAPERGDRRGGRPREDVSPEKERGRREAGSPSRVARIRGGYFAPGFQPTDTPKMNAVVL